MTVHKTSKTDKIGIYVHLENFSNGNRLVISKVAHDGKFTNTRIKKGDIIVSINGEDMIENPKLDKALSKYLKLEPSFEKLNKKNTKAHLCLFKLHQECMIGLGGSLVLVLLRICYFLTLYKASGLHIRSVPLLDC